MVYHLNRLGATLIISARREKELERVKQACQYPDKVIVQPLDLSVPENVSKDVAGILAQREKLPPIDILINNAGISMRVAFLDNDLVSDAKMMDLNVLSQIAITRVNLLLVSPLLQLLL